MPVPLFSQDHYVVLETHQPEQFLTAAEMQAKLAAVLTTRQDGLPPDLQRLTTVTEQVNYLLETTCELDMGPGEFLQWYAVRLEK